MNVQFPPPQTQERILPQNVWPTLTTTQQTLVCQTLVHICHSLVLTQEKEDNGHESAHNATGEQP